MKKIKEKRKKYVGNSNEKKNKHKPTARLVSFLSVLFRFLACVSFLHLYRTLVITQFLYSIANLANDSRLSLRFVRIKYFSRLLKYGKIRRWNLLTTRGNSFSIWWTLSKKKKKSSWNIQIKIWCSNGLCTAASIDGLWPFVWRVIIV